MNRVQVLLTLNERAKNSGFGQLPRDYAPSSFLTQLGATDWEQFWTGRVAEARQSIQAYVWQGDLLPTGRPAPAEAVPGASYVLVVPNGAVVFQYADSPYAPETPGLAPGALSPENVRAAMEAHAQHLAEMLAVERLAQEYLEWLAEQLL